MTVDKEEKTTKLCSFYINVKDMVDGERKTFHCNCRRHKGTPISVMKENGIVTQVISGTAKKQEEYTLETFRHMLTVLNIMFGDARVMNNELPCSGDKKENEAFEYAESWLEEYRKQL